MASAHTAYGEAFQTPQSSQSPALQPDASISLRERKKKQQQPRQLLSCTKCRERKVKCDRTKPCSACCARGLPKDCHFVLGEGTEFGPIQQSLELRKLRAENQRLKERLLTAKVSLSDDSEDDDGSSTGKPGQSTRREASRQKRFRTGDHTDSLYFGSPGLANVISDFASLQVEPKSLAFTMPRGADMYAEHHSMFPFPALWQATTATEGLLQCLEPRADLLKHIGVFADKAVGFAFPFLPEELTQKEVEHFLHDAEQNAELYPDALAMIFAGSALGLQLGGDGQDAQKSRDRIRGGDVFMAASMQALRISAFMSRPTLRSVHALLLLGPYLTNSGRFLDAWSIFGLTIRLAQSIGLHRNPKYLDPIPELRECTIRSNIWWWMLHIDQLYSMTLGRPLGISGIGDCPPAEPLTTNPAVLRLGEFVDQLTLLGRQILSSNQLTDPRIDMFTDRLASLWDTMPDILQFNESWSDSDTQIPEYPLCATAAVHYCKIHSYIILLNRQRIENTRGSPEFSSPSPKGFSSVPTGPGYSDVPLVQPHTLPRGRPMVLSSSISLLNAFIYFFRRVEVALIDWTVGQQAFNACLILLLDALETGDTQSIPKVEQAYAVFVRLDKNSTHPLAEMAVARISEGLLRLRDVVDKASRSGSHSGPPGSKYYEESAMGNTGMFLLEDPGLQSRRVSTPTMPSGGRHLQPSPSDQSAQGTRRPSSTAPQEPPRLQQQPYPHLDTYLPPQTGAYHNMHYAAPPSAYNYAVGSHPRLYSRHDSVTAGSRQMLDQMVPSTSPQPPDLSPYPVPTMQAPPAPQHFQGHDMQQQCQVPHQRQQFTEHEWQALRLQQMAHHQAMQQSTMYPPHEARR